MLGDIDRRAAVLAAEREALEEAERHEQDRRGDADLAVVRQQADQEGRAAHDEQRDEEGVLAADQVADAAEDERAEGAGGESRAEGRQRREQRGRRVAARDRSGAR